MVQYTCPECGGNVRTLNTKKGTKVYCRHCGATSVTKEDNFPDGEPTQEPKKEGER